MARDDDDLEKGGLGRLLERNETHGNRKNRENLELGVCCFCHWAPQDR